MTSPRRSRIKVIIPIAIVLLILIIVAFSNTTDDLKQIPESNKTTPHPQTPALTPAKPAPTEPAPKPTTTPSLATQTPANRCENCHMKNKPGVPAATTVHNNMSRYCLYCHTIDHNTHPMPEDGVPCKSCHGEEQTVPSIEQMTTNCGNCHNYPDPLKRSNGNIVTIHRPRNVSCIECHGNNVIEIHLHGKNVNIEEMLTLLNRR